MTVTAQNGVTTETHALISTPDTVESRIGTLELDGGVDAAELLGR